MIIWAWIDASFFWIMGILLFIHLIKSKNEEKQIKDIYSEIIESILFIIVGFYVLNMFPDTVNARITLYLIHIIAFSVITIFFFGFNVFPNYLKSRRDPSYRKNLSYYKFLEKLDNKYKTQEEGIILDKYKDLSRKILHIIQFIGVITIYFVSIYFIKENNKWEISPLQFRNFLYTLIAGFFWIMMMVGDLTRLNGWKYLPQWGIKWYEKSLELNRERWTLNAVTPILLANLIWIHEIFPIQVFFSAVWVSCIGDAIASIVGKNFGKHKLKFGYYPEKSIEGLIAGIFTTSIGIFLLFLIFPFEGLTLLNILIISFVCGIIFLLTDAYIRHFCDNLLNALLIGFFTWILLLVLS
ncbi:MAG: phosphatidate cytidylyltransferase [Promethearchaeota archaeon]